ncbi:hypothetical protein SELMODRAFT_106976, partial [Selaginella moellendorffii]
AAMAWGTHSCPKVDKILGPENRCEDGAKLRLLLFYPTEYRSPKPRKFADRNASAIHVREALAELPRGDTIIIEKLTMKVRQNFFVFKLRTLLSLGKGMPS